jgi:hypothetical protein
MCRKKGTDKYIKNKEDKDMSKLHDKRVRLLMVKRYLNAETSIDEERELSEFYTTTTEKLTSEDEDVQLLLQATSTTDENFELSKSKVAEFDRMMDSLPCQRTHVPEGTQEVPARQRLLTIAGWISAVAASIGLLFILFDNNTSGNTESFDEQMAITQSGQIGIHVETEKPEELMSATETPHISSASAGGGENVRHMKPRKSRQTKHSTVKPNEVKPIEAFRANSHSLDEVMTAANIMGEQVETYHIQSAGDATIVTKTFVDGTSSSCLVCAMDGGCGYSVIPL